VEALTLTQQVVSGSIDAHTAGGWCKKYTIASVDSYIKETRAAGDECFKDQQVLSDINSANHEGRKRAQHRR